MSQQRVHDEIIRDVVAVVMDVIAKEEARNKKLQMRRNAAAAEKERERGSKYLSDRMDNNRALRIDDEIQGQKSVTTIATIKAGNVPREFDASCTACGQIAVYNALKKLKLKSKCTNHRQTGSRRKTGSGSKSRRKKKTSRRNQRKGRRANDKLVGVDKNNRKVGRTSNPVYKFCSYDHRSHQCLATMVTNKSCQCSLVTIFTKNSVNHKSRQCSASNSIKIRKSSERNGPETPGMDCANPDQHQMAVDSDGSRPQSRRVISRNSSVSSYYSYLSLDHEPMDANT